MIAGTESASTFAAQLSRAKSPIPIVIRLISRLIGMASLCKKVFSEVSNVPVSSDLLYLVQVSAVAFRGHVVAMHETQRSRVDAIAQSALVARAILEDMAQMAVPVDRAYFGTGHSV